MKLNYRIGQQHNKKSQVTKQQRKVTTRLNKQIQKNKIIRKKLTIPYNKISTLTKIKR